jgi:hypothetical protein
VISIAIPTQAGIAVARLDAWLDSMRGPAGYGGPVAHWWRQSLSYTGAGLDWRYEGIIAGYLCLWQASGDGRWLAKAQRAGDDLLAGQIASGNYAASAFEINPATAGTPHEAACDAGLLLLARALHAAGRPGWNRYADCAERNLRAFYLGQLWDAEAQSFRDSPSVPSFVPNKAATACDALFLLADLTGDAEWAERYALPNLGRIIAHQARGGPLDGAIAQNSFGARIVEKYFPIYIARCVPALLRGACWTGDDRYAESALAAMRFVARWMSADGELPAVVYPNRQLNRYPSWIAPLGDILRAADELRPYGYDADLSALERRLLAGQDASGGIQTARGFAAQAGGRMPALPDARDLLHVAGWCDKAFRYLALHAGELPTQVASTTFEAECVFRGQRMLLAETPETLEVTQRRTVVYRWRKGQSWAEITSPLFWLV